MIFFFHIAASRRATLLLQRLLKSQMFQPDPQLATTHSYCIKKHHFFSSKASAGTSVDYTVDYIIQHHYG